MRTFRHGLLIACIWIAFAGLGAAQEEKRLAWPKPLPEGAKQRLGSGGLMHLHSSVLTPDGKHLLMYSRKEEIAMIELATGRRVHSFKLKSGSYPANLLVTHDSNTLVVRDFNQCTLYDLTNGTIQKQLRLYSDIAGDVHWGMANISGNGNLLAEVTQMSLNAEPCQARVIDTETGAKFGPFITIHNQMLSGTISPDGLTLATWGQYSETARNLGSTHPKDRIIQLWDIKTGKEKERITVENTPLIRKVAFSPLGDQLAVMDLAGRSNACFLYDLNKIHPPRILAGRKRNLFQLDDLIYQINVLFRYSPDGKYIAYGSLPVIKIWDVQMGVLLDVPKAPQIDEISDIVFLEPGRIMALGVRGKTLIWWDVLKGEVGYPFYGHSTGIHSLAFSPKGNQLTSVDSGAELIRWDLNSGKSDRHLSLIKEKYRLPILEPLSISSIISPNCELVGISTKNAISVKAGTCITEISTGRRIHNFKQLSSIAIASQAQKTVAVSGEFAGPKLTIKIFDLDGIKLIAKYEMADRIQKYRPEFLSAKEDHYLWPTAFSNYGDLIAISRNGFDTVQRTQVSNVIIVDAAEGKEIHSLTEDTLRGQASPLSFSPNNKFLAFRNSSGVHLIEPRTGKSRVVLPLDSKMWDINHLVFAPDSRTIASFSTAAQQPSRSAKIDIWEVATGRLQQNFQLSAAEEDDNPLQKFIQLDAFAGSSFAFSPDGNTLASSTDDGSILLWDTSGRPAKLKELSPQELSQAWSELENRDAKLAFRAKGQMLGSPNEAVAFIQQNLKPAEKSKVDEKQIQQWVTDLDSDAFSRRETAFRELSRLESSVESILQKARKDSKSPESQRRLDDLLGRLEGKEIPAEQLRHIRAVDVLERIGSVEARTLLTRLAEGGAAAILTQEARSSLERLKK